MNVGKTLFAQVMEYVPWNTFERIVGRHGGDAGVRTLSIFEKTPISCALQPDTPGTIAPQPGNQMILFDY